MKAQITHYNSKQGYYSAVCESRIKAVFTLLEPGELRLDDVLNGNFDSLGVHTVANETDGNRLKIEVKEIYKIDAPFRGHSGNKPK
jgi:hypothetical protein